MKASIMIVIVLLASTNIVIAQEVARGWSVNRIVALNEHPNYSVNGIKLAVGGESGSVMGSGWKYMRMWRDNRNWMEVFPCPPYCIYGLYFDLDDGTGEPGESTELSTGGVLGMSLTSDAEGYYVVWVEGVTYTYNRVVYAKINPEGNVILTREIVSRSPPEDLDEPEVILDQQGNLNIVYSSSRDPERNNIWDIEYTKIDKNGNILVQPTVIARSHDNIGFGNEHIAIDPTDQQGIIHVVYTKYEHATPQYGNLRYVNYMRLSPSGLVLADTTFAGGPYRNTFSSSIAADEGKVHMVMHDRGCNSYPGPPVCGPGQQSQLDIIYAQANTATGEITVSPKAITNDVHDEFEPVIAVRGDGRVVLVWETETIPDIEENLFYSELNRQGNTLVPPTQLTFEHGYQWPKPSIAIAPDNKIFTGWMNKPSSPGGIVYDKYYLPTIGSAVTLRGTSTLVGIDAPLDVGHQYAVGASFGNIPGIGIPNFGRILLNPDPLLEISFAGFMSNNIGTLGSDGHGTFQINMPAMAPPNIMYYVAGVLFENDKLVGTTGSASMRVR